MPAAVDRCKESLLKKWRSNPDQKPKRFKQGDKWKEIESPKDLESAAWAICQSSVKACYECEDEDDILLAQEGHGPTLFGVAALNDPHISGMERLKIVTKDGKEFVKAQVLRFGAFAHSKAPNGKLIINQRFFDTLIKNFKDNVLGRVPVLDDAHRENRDSYGDIVDLEQEDDRLYAIVDPTPLGLDKVKNRLRNYASAWLHTNWKGTQLEFSFSEAEEIGDEDVLDLALEQSREGNMPQEDKNKGAPQPPEGGVPDGMVQLSQEEHEALLAAAKKVETIEKKHEDEFKLMQEANEKFMAKLQEQYDAIATVRVQQEEEIRLKQTDLLIQQLSMPDDKGNMLSKPLLELGRTALRGEPFNDGEDGEAEVKLSRDDGKELTLGDVHAYYRHAIQQILSAAPRTVPGSKLIEPFERRLSDNGSDKRAEFIRMRRENFIETGLLGGEYTKEELVKMADERFPLPEGGE